MRSGDEVQSQGEYSRKKDKDPKAKTSKQGKRNYLYVSYNQLKRNLAAMHKMLRVNNIR